MKIKHILLSFCLLGATLSACDYLDIVPDDTPTLDDAFKTETGAEGFVFACYSKIPNYMHFRENTSWVTTPELVGSAHWTVQWFTFMQMQQATYNAADPVIDVWQSSYDGIRQCYTFLDNIDKVIPVKETPAAFDAKKKVWKAEVKFLIAYYHFLLLQNYGPIVVIDHLIPTDAPAEEMFQARLPYDECVNRIAAMFDEAIPDLPETVNEANLGRATSVIAESLKARMFLYAASPQFNGNTDYSDFRDKEGTQLISTTYDKEKWRKAMDQCWVAIQAAERSGRGLYYYTPKAGQVLSARDQAIANCRYVVVDPWNKELIWGYTGWKESFADAGSIQAHIIPHGISASTGAPYGALGPTLWSTNLFLTENALPIDKDPKFHYADRFKLPEGETEIPYLHRNREPRFYGAVGFDDGSYLINSDTIKLALKFKEPNGAKDANSDQLYAGYALAKFAHPNTYVSLSSNALTYYPFPIIRLAELYLAYAEATAEYTGKLEGEAKTRFNEIRKRAGLPSIDVSHPGVQGEDLVNVIRREKTVEFMYEGQMLYDYRRWKIAVKEWAGMENGMLGLNVYGSTPEEFYKPTVLDRQPFVFRSFQTLAPIKQDYLNKNIHLIQNPGW
ncbi:RagB/SusD family nutrient uptake outer membrane protein [Phocaeicola sp.]